MWIARTCKAASAKLRELGLPARLMVDCSHDNCARDHRNQVRVADTVASQLAAGSDAIMGVMLESHLEEGRQELRPGHALRYGQSITDACVDLDITAQILAALADAVRTGRAVRPPLESDALAPFQVVQAC